MWLSRSAAALALLWASSAAAVDCPTYPDPSTVVTGWPLDKTPNVSKIWAGQCGSATTGGTVYACTGGAVQGLVVGSPGAGIALAQASMQSNYSGTQTFTVTGYVVSGLHRACVVSNSPSRSCRVDTTYTAAPCDPPAPVETDCSPATGKHITLSGATTAELGKTVCVSTCEVKAGRVAVKNPATGMYTYRGQVTGENCPEGAPAGPSGDDPVTGSTPSNEQCVTTSGGQSFCAPQDKQNCGWYNDKYTCVNSIPPGGCIKNEAGKLFCDPAASTPPVPNNGTAGTKAVPEDVVETAHSSAGEAGGAGAGDTVTNRTTNVYGTAQQSGSTRDTTSGVTGSTGGTVVPGGDAAGTGGEGTGEEGDDLGEIEGYAGCEGEGCVDVGSMFEAYRSQLYAVPIVAAWNGIGGEIPAGSCPEANVTVFGQVHSFSEFACQIWTDQVVPMVSLVFLFVWPFMGLRIVMSA